VISKDRSHPVHLDYIKLKDYLIEYGFQNFLYTTILGTLHEDLGTLYNFDSSAVQKKSLLPSTVTLPIFYIFNDDICSSTIRKES
jgi:hypothetical protein